MISITATDLKQWSPRRAQDTLPKLVRLLIHAITTDLRQPISMPSGDSVQKPGLDGIVQRGNAANEFVPPDTSVWEIGSDKDYKAKANREYTKRTQNPLGFNPQHTVFVFVTSQQWWTGKQDWITEKQAENRWADVRVYDADDLEHWLEQAPAVAAWLGRELGKPAASLRFLEQYWLDYAADTNPPLSPQLLLGGREAAIQQLAHWLHSAPSVLNVHADSPAESLAFIGAALWTLPEEDKNHWLARTLIVDSLDDWTTVSSCRHSLLLILHSPEASAGRATQAGHHVLLPLGRDTGTDKDADIVLPRLSSANLMTALREMGVAVARAEFLVRQTGRSLTALRRKLAHDPRKELPDWAKRENARQIIPALLASGWAEETTYHDQEILSRLGGCHYEEVAQALSGWLHVSDSPLRKVAQVWKIPAPVDAWLLLGRYLTTADWENFRQVVLEVLGQTDPRFDLPPENRWAANVYGKATWHSGLLRESMVENLILIAMFGEDAEIGLQSSPQSFVNWIIRDLLAEADGLRWGSLSHLLPSLAEAAPETFLRAVEDGLTSDTPPVMALFEEEGEHGACHACGLLWALESLAWKPVYLTRVTLILGTLARLDPGGRWGNRPDGSLREIFLAWANHTAADVKQKLAALDKLFTIEPDVGWKTLLSLIPHWHEISHNSHTPYWRDWAAITSKKTTRIEFDEYITALLQRLIENVGEDRQRWLDLIEDLGHLPADSRNTVIDKLSKFPAADCDVDLKLALWPALRKLLHRHRGFEDTDWALSTDELDRLENIYHALTPAEPLLRFGWLFDKFWPDLPEGDRRVDYEAREQKIAELRREGLRQIFTTGGMDDVLYLCSNVESIHWLNWLGVTATEALPASQLDSWVFSQGLGNSDNKLKQFAMVILRKRFSEGNMAWADKILLTASRENWSAHKIADFFLTLPDNMETWHRLGNFDSEVAQHYWQHVIPWTCEDCIDDTIFAVKKLLEAKRPYIILNLIRFDKNRKWSLPAELILQALELILLEYTEDKATNESKISRYRYKIEDAFKALDHSDKVDQQRLISLEWAYSGVLLHTERGIRILYQQLQDDHGFFVQMLTWIYRSEADKTDKFETALTKEQIINRAETARHILEEWGYKYVPGIDENGQLDNNKLLNWVHTARAECAAVNRTKIGDREIGKLLVYATDTQDKIWPSYPVRILIEELRSHDFEEGLLHEKMYPSGLRLIEARDLNEGGKRDHELARKYRTQAEELASEWPRTADLLFRLAECHSSSARRDDEYRDMRELRDS